MQNDTSVKVAVRIRPLSDIEASSDDSLCIDIAPGGNQVVAGSDLFFTFDHAFGVDTKQSAIFDECVRDLLDSTFEGFNATIVAYGQTGSGKTFTMGSSSDVRITSESMGIIPRAIQMIFDTILEKELSDPQSSYKVSVQFLEIYGEDIRDLLDKTRTSKVTIRETINGEVFVSGAREEIVSSTAQMMKTLEEGTKHRTTASTGMNNESSRSHAIFTIILEQTIQTAVIDDQIFNYEKTSIDLDGIISDTPRKTRTSIGISRAAAEVRRSKFHFVDLAGSERIKRTKAQGIQLKEGIDINKGLLALGNVISALGDEQKRGKVHVPYRDSKLTRILQDSLGGNSKTLFICCVSPSNLNFHESVNALKYANRARNIKNKPIVNRDPTLFVIDELKDLVQNLACELLAQRKLSSDQTNSTVFSQEYLEELASLSLSGKSKPVSSTITQIPTSESFQNLSQARDSQRTSSPVFNRNKEKETRSNNKQMIKEMDSLKSKLAESEFELRRVTELVKTLRLESSDLTERILLAESERDFYRIKWSNSSPDESKMIERINLSDSIDSIVQLDDLKEKDKFIDALTQYKRENESLKSQLSSLQNMIQSSSNGRESFLEVGENLETELTTSVARVIAQTKEQLLQEAKRLERVAEECGLQKSRSSLIPTSVLDYDSDNDGDGKVSAEVDANAEEESFQIRQKNLSAQLQELGESILLKENLVLQLKRSQEQYSLMKAFYEQKLSNLQKEVEEKQVEREKLITELHEISSSQNQTVTQMDEEKRLKEELKRKDDELKQLKKKQDELSNLSQVQTRYLSQLKKMETDVEVMKKQKVDLTKLLQNEKKKHLTLLHEKVKEVERLKRELVRTSGDIKKLTQEKVRAEERAKEAIREGAALRKRKNEIALKTELNSSRISTKALVKITNVKSASISRFLTQDEIKTKKWLISCMNKLIERENSIESLRKQCDQQASLLAQRDDLEAQKATFESSDAADKEETLADIEEKLVSINQQLKLKANTILKLQVILDQGEETSEIYDKTIESMKRNISIHLLRLLFEMLVKTQQSANLYKDLLDKTQVREKSLKLEIDGERLKYNSLRRQYENEIILAKQDYEEKLQGLFENSAVSRILQSESNSIHIPTHFDGSIEHFVKDAHSTDSYKMVVAILTDRCNNMQNQVQQLTSVNDTLKNDIDSLEHTLKHTQHELEESESMINFLESERQLFRDMVNDLRSGIMTFGGATGQLIINQVREKAMEKEREGAARHPQGFQRSLKLSINEANESFVANDDDDESILTEFNELADEIARTGTLGSSTKLKGVVYDRLTNPLNFTGSMKNVFEKDLAVKRQKVQKIKNQIQPHPHQKLGTETSEELSRSASQSRRVVTSSLNGFDTSLRSSAHKISSSFTRLSNNEDGAKENDARLENADLNQVEVFPSDTDHMVDVVREGQRNRLDSDPESLCLSIDGTSVNTLEDSPESKSPSPMNDSQRRSAGNERALSITDRLHLFTTQSLRSKLNANQNSGILNVRSSLARTHPQI